MSHSRGRFVTIEGPEGAGKSTQLEFLVENLVGRGYQVVSTREPGGTQVAEKVRAVLLDPANKPMSTDTETLLMFAARADHIEQVIEPALSAGKWVICDRFTDATYAYQGGGRGVSRQRISELETWVQGSLRPDLCLLMDLDVQIGLERAGLRSDADRFEQERQDFFERVRHAYLERARCSPSRYSVIDASQSIDGVQEQMRKALRKLE